MSTGLKIVVFSTLCLIWSSTWIMIKVGLEGAPPITAAGLRFTRSSRRQGGPLAIPRDTRPIQQRRTTACLSIRARPLIAEFPSQRAERGQDDVILYHLGLGGTSSTRLMQTSATHPCSGNAVIEVRS